MLKILIEFKSNIRISKFSREIIRIRHFQTDSLTLSLPWRCFKYLLTYVRYYRIGAIYKNKDLKVKAEIIVRIRSKQNIRINCLWRMVYAE